MTKTKTLVCSWLFLTNWETPTMSIRVSDWQSKSGLDSISKSCNVFFILLHLKDFVYDFPTLKRYFLNKELLLGERSIIIWTMPILSFYDINSRIWFPCLIFLFCKVLHLPILGVWHCLWCHRARWEGWDVFVFELKLLESRLTDVLVLLELIALLALLASLDLLALLLLLALLALLASLGITQWLTFNLKSRYASTSHKGDTLPT